jgi:chitin synthase
VYNLVIGINEEQLDTMRPLSDMLSMSDIYNYESEIEASSCDSDTATPSGLLKMKFKPRRRMSPSINLSGSRKLWLVITWAITWWIPAQLLEFIGRMKRPDIRMAWREKFTLCFLILLLSAAMVWFIAFFSHIICPVKHIYSKYELQSKTNSADGIVSIRGEVFDLGKFAPRHWASEIIPNMALVQYAGKDVSHLFPVQVSALCDGAQNPVSLAISLDNYVGLTDPNAKYHDFRYFTDDYRPDWYYEKMTYLRKNYRLGYMGYDVSDVRYQANNPRQFGGITSTRNWAILNGDIYDLTFYFMGGISLRVPGNQTTPNDVDVNFIDNTIAQLFKVLAGTDITDVFNQLPMDHNLRERQLTCLRNLFLVGKVDARNSPQCVFSEYLLLIISGFLCSVILFKFVAALQVTQSSGDIEYSNFIVCQVPCYTEGEESIRKTLNSIATLKYDDKRKLLFIITDGMIVGSGNEKSTPRIVLDILGVDESIDRDALYYNAIGEGNKQHNMAKVYSGLYEYSGHAVPYIVVVKVGNLAERQKPGNRGKRDSQMVLLQFLNKVHYQSDMNPLEYEIYHQIQHVIGVNPFFYEYVMMVDADTEVFPDSLNSLVSSFINDDKVIGMCGETMLSNEKDTWVTMIQVYEYYISHFLSKAFESLFGTVTCLPGCFCMYRIRSVGRNQALLVSNIVMLEYGDIKVDTLHKKNLLHLGEDRYLTTLILKHFPNYKTKFNPNAACLTNAPDSWSVLVSQRRRWINSTIHNLGELIFLPQMCGFCCFSMRFVVILDLLSTLVMPAVVCYLGYLIYEISTHSSQVPLMSLITLASVYGLQAFIFIVRRKVRSSLRIRVNEGVYDNLNSSTHKFLLLIFMVGNSGNTSPG